MPVMDGIDCIKQLRLWEMSERPDLSLHVIGISANASLHEQKLNEGENFPFERHGFSNFIQKPISIKTVADVCKSSDVVKMGAALDEIDMKMRAETQLKIAAGESPMWKVESMDRFSAQSHGSAGSFHKTSSNGSSMDSLAGMEDSPAQEVFAKFSCLIAEDSVTVRKMLKKVAEESGCDLVKTLGDEDGLFDELCLRRYDVVLVDEGLQLNKTSMNLNGSGSRAIRKFKEWEEDAMVRVPQRNVWCISANDMPANFGAELFSGYILKPISFEKLQDLFLSVKRKKSNMELLQDGERKGGKEV